jgi:hypothetical protein
MPLIKLEPIDIRAYWPPIRDAVIRAAAPLADQEEAAKATLARLVSDTMQAWLLTDSTETLKAVLVTGFEHDPLGGVPALAIHFFSAQAKITEAEYQEIRKVILSYAAKTGLKVVYAITEVEYLKTLWQALGGTTKWMLYKEV